MALQPRPSGFRLQYTAAASRLPNAECTGISKQRYDSGIGSGLSRRRRRLIPVNQVCRPKYNYAGLCHGKLAAARASCIDSLTICLKDAVDGFLPTALTGKVEPPAAPFVRLCILNRLTYEINFSLFLGTLRIRVEY